MANSKRNQPEFKSDHQTKKAATGQDLRRGKPAPSARSGRGAEGKSRADPTKPQPRTEPAKTYVVNSAGTATPEKEPLEKQGKAKTGAATDEADVRIGPGDAGAQSSPRPLEVKPGDRTSSRTAVVILAIVIGLAILVAIAAMV